MSRSFYSPKARRAEKDEYRRSVERALVSGAKSVPQAKREHEAFAFPPGQARIKLGSAKRLI